MEPFISRDENDFPSLQTEKMFKMGSD